jgi:hypothetical protein
LKRILVAGIFLSALVLPSTAPACSWPAKSDLDTMNVAFPDDAATYWVARYTGAPGAEIVIRGRYPDARYFSFHIYDEALRPIDSVSDFETAPDGAGGYTTGFTFEAPQSGALIYRVYVSGVPGDPAGGVPLPDISLKVSGREEELPLGPCESLPPATGGGVNQAIKGASYPAQAPRGYDFAGITDPPTTERFYGFDRLILNPIPPNPVTDSVPRTSGGFWSNQHIAYLTTRFGRRNDGRELLVTASARRRHRGRSGTGRCARTSSRRSATSSVSPTTRPSSTTPASSPWSSRIRRTGPRTPSTGCRGEAPTTTAL